MGLVLTATVGLSLWIILWALNISGLDGFMIVILMVLVAVGVRMVAPYRPGRRD